MSEVEKNEMTEVMNTIVQIGVVMPDMDEVVQGMRDVFGLESDSVKDYLYNVRYRGKEQKAPACIAFYNFFNIQLEFIVPIGEDKTVWSDYLELGQRGLHHIRFDVPDNDELTRRFNNRGMDIWMEGDSIVSPGKKFTYYDTLAKLGFIVEAVTK